MSNRDGCAIAIAGAAGAGKDTIAMMIKNYCEQKSMNFEITSWAKCLKDICGKVFNLTHDDMYCQYNDATKFKRGKGRILEVPIIITREIFTNIVEEAINYVPEIDVYKVPYSITELARYGQITSNEWWKIGNPEYPELKVSDGYVLNAVLYQPRQILQYVGTNVLRYLDESYHLKATLNRNEMNGVKNFIIPDTRFPNEADAIHNYKKKTQRNFVFKVNRSKRDSVIDIKPHPSETVLNDYTNWSLPEIENNGNIIDLKDKVENMVDHFIL